MGTNRRGSIADLALLLSQELSVDKGCVLASLWMAELPPVHSLVRVLRDGSCLKE